MMGFTETMMLSRNFGINKPYNSSKLSSNSRLLCTSSVQQVLDRVDEELGKGDDRTALSLVKDSQGKPGGGGGGALRCFGSATQIPQRLYTLEELKLNGINASLLLSPVDSTLESIERNFQIGALMGGISAWSVFGFSNLDALIFSVGTLFLWSIDLIAFNGGVKNLALDSLAHVVSNKYNDRVIQHEAGHFLMAYFLGVLPKGYTLSSLEAWRNQGSLNVQAGTNFVDFEFVEEVNTGKLTASMLNKFSCIALAGVITEYLLFGYSEGGLADINQLDGLFKSLGFTQKKADSQVRWAVLNTTLILRRHEKTRSKLAEAMASGNSVGFCINLIEKQLIDSSDV